MVLNRSLASILLSAANEICPIGLVDFPQLPLSLDIRAVHLLHPAAAEISAPAAPIAAAVAQSPPDDLLPLGPGGVLDEHRFHMPHLPSWSVYPRPGAICPNFLFRTPNFALTFWLKSCMILHVVKHHNFT